MKIRISKLYKVCPITGDLSAANIMLSNSQQTRNVTGKIGGPDHEGVYDTSLRGDGRVVIDMEPDTTLQIHSAE